MRRYFFTLLMSMLAAMTAVADTFTVRYKFNAAQSKYKGTGAGSSEKERL